ncbi:MAG: hypothetical protein HYU67_13380 [Flavobacteriia bacterium]|nr:hypothetical protein [Flavobacteriia bacterium]
MKNVLNSLLTIALLFSIVSSCTVQKRLHQKGYFVQWHKNYKTTAENDESQKNITISEISNNEDFTLSNEEISINNSFSNTEMNHNKLNSFDKNENLFTSEENAVSTSSNDILHEMMNSEVEHKSQEINVSSSKQTKNESNLNQKSRIDGDLTINIILTVLFAGLIVLFVILGLAAVAPMIYVWYGLAGLSAIVFITQIIDLIRY